MILYDIETKLTAKEGKRGLFDFALSRVRPFAFSISLKYFFTSTGSQDRVLSQCPTYGIQSKSTGTYSTFLSMLLGQYTAQRRLILTRVPSVQDASICLKYVSEKQVLELYLQKLVRQLASIN
ncbi:hypothetical protein TNCV_636051 [Trichonephila clavipes]|nr:hypothetical protein TNCV_636051 [Trichonephila clavipes]